MILGKVLGSSASRLPVPGIHACADTQNRWMGGTFVLGTLEKAGDP